jgi:hypothetical protein
MFHHLLGKPDGVSWLAAVFMFVGYITHLTLDEIYSVDVMDTRIKSSFGTALKLFDRRHVYASAAMAGAVVAAIMLSPRTDTFVEGLSSHSMWTGLEQRLLPTDKWFGLIETPHFASRKQNAGEAITTGSIADHPTNAEKTPPAITVPVPAARGPEQVNPPAETAQPVEAAPAPSRVQPGSAGP